MGGGAWNRGAFSTYSRSRGRSVADDGTLSGNYSAQDIFRSRRLDSALNPYKVIRECCDSEEHPETIPVILALDVTGSMGMAAVEVAKKLNTVMTELYQSTKDVEFMIMGIGDLAYDRAPVQASQFESDIRIAEQLDKIYFEGGGGGNGYESYTAAWYFALNHTKLDCHKRGKKGLIITMGDEPLNPYLPKNELNAVTGDRSHSDVDTGILFSKTAEKFDIYHLAVIDSLSCGGRYTDRIRSSFGEYLDSNHLREVNLDNITPVIIEIVKNFAENSSEMITEVATDEQPEEEKKKGFFERLISW